MEEDNKKIYAGLEYGVELFKCHAVQRLNCIRYYIVILIAIIGGIIGIERILCDQDFPKEIIFFSICMGAGITLFFWLLDIRNRVLTEYAEDGLKKVEYILFSKAIGLQKLQIVNNCEDRKKAWHYGDIVPVFFFLSF